MLVLFEEDYCLLPINSRKGVVGWAKVDFEDFPKLWSGSLSYAGPPGYCYLRTSKGGSRVAASRIVMGAERWQDVVRVGEEIADLRKSNWKLELNPIIAEFLEERGLTHCVRNERVDRKHPEVHDCFYRHGSPLSFGER